MTFFSNIETIEQLKAAYRKLALKFHPDKGGSTEMMQMLNSQYAFMTAKILSGSNFSQQERDFEANESVKYKDIINAIINLSGIEIEVCGSWIWVSGNTRMHKEVLKANGFYWASKKMMWYYRPAEYKSTGKGKTFEIGQIRAKYGSQAIKTGGRVLAY